MRKKSSDSIFHFRHKNLLKCTKSWVTLYDLTRKLSLTRLRRRHFRAIWHYLVEFGAFLWNLALCYGISLTSTDFPVVLLDTTGASTTGGSSTPPNFWRDRDNLLQSATTFIECFHRRRVWKFLKFSIWISFSFTVFWSLSLVGLIHGCFKHSSTLSLLRCSRTNNVRIKSLANSDVWEKNSSSNS